jgi:hypothetical protein
LNIDLIDIAIKKASQSPCKSKISAIGLNKHGKVVSTACNHPRFSRYGGGVHAEIKALARGGIKVHSMIICRVGRLGDIRPIECCPACKKVLDKKGIKVYSIKPI